MVEKLSSSAQARSIEGELCVSAAALMDLLDVSYQTLTDWAKKGLPKAKRGWYPLKRTLAWRGTIQGDSVKDKSVNLMQRKLEAEVALKESQQELTKLKTDITNGKYLERELVTEEYRRFFVVLKRAVMAIPRRAAGVIAAYVEPVEARRLEKELNTMVIAALESFVKSGVVMDEKGKG